MAHKIASVEPGSIAEQCGLRPGDALLSINGAPVLDQIDYQALTAQESLVLMVDKGEAIEEIALEKDESEPLGIVFSSTLMSKPRVCANRCVFCFIDQMPPGMRTSLYVKDDDWRLSLMMGNYITLTNVSDAEFERMIARRASPLYISVHAADPAVRARIMGNPRAADLMPKLRRLADAGIAFHCQIVLCPGINDGPVLDETLASLAALYPAARSAALVPVGLTKHREGLAVLEPYTAQSARALLAQAQKWQAKFLREVGTRFVFPADEVYCLSGEPVPPEDAYEGYPQIENGVGLLRSFAGEFETARRFADSGDIVPRSVAIVSGTSAAALFRDLIEQAPMQGVQASVLPVTNRFFGPTVTVTGLLTGQDIYEAIADIQADEILISQTTLRHEGDCFLDDMTLDTLRQRVHVPIHVVECDGAAFFYALQGELYTAEG